MFDLPTKIGKQFASAFDTRLVEATTASWHYWFGLLETFVEEYGNARPSQSFKTAEGYALGRWVTKQRPKKAKLPAERVARLEALPGWVWDQRDFQWEEGFRHLKAFATKEGYARPPALFETAEGYALGKWVRRGRQKKTELPAERVARLAALPGWVWDERDFRWEEGFRHLEIFAEKEGHALPPRSFKAANGYRLGSWVQNQRVIKAKLPAERVARLEALPGWVWNTLDFQWEEGFRHLKAFATKEGHARPPTAFKAADGFRLGAWVDRQRQAKAELTAERVARLEALPGWAWGKLDFQWEEGFRHLKAFATKEGHARPPIAFKTAEGFSLGTWVGTQRVKKTVLTAERVARLEALPGWVWNTLDFRWEEGFRHLKAFATKEGPCATSR